MSDRDNTATEVKGTTGREFVISREFDAPRELVWKAFTEPERLTHWWGPKGFTMQTCTVDLRPGGAFAYGMTSPEGYEMWGKLVYREIVPPERIECIVSFTDEKGNAIRHPMEPSWPLEVLSTITLSERGGKTTVTNTSAAHNASEAERKTFEAGFASMEQGFTGTLDQLAEYLATAAAEETKEKEHGQHNR